MNLNEIDAGGVFENREKGLFSCIKTLRPNILETVRARAKRRKFYLPHPTWDSPPSSQRWNFVSISYGSRVVRLLAEMATLAMINSSKYKSKRILCWGGLGKVRKQAKKG